MATRGGDYGRYDHDWYSGEGRRFAGNARSPGGDFYRGEDSPRSPGQSMARSTGSSYEQQRAEHRGRGPRGYRRSDERIREDVCERLTDDPYIDASELEVNVKDGEVILSGMVDSRRDKRYAEDIAAEVPGVKDVHNSLRASPDPSRAAASERRSESSNPMSDMTATQAPGH